MRYLAAACASTVLLGLSLPAQDRPVLQLAFDGPAGIRTALLPTNLGSQLASEEARELWVPLEEMLDRALEGAGLDEKTAADGKQALLAYGGRVRISVDLAPDRREGARHFADLPTTALIRLGPDGRTDLAAIGAIVDRWVRGMTDAPAQALETEQGTWQMLTLGGQQVALPRIIDGDLVAAVGEHVEHALRDLAPGTKRAVDRNRPVLAARVDLARLMEHAGREADDQVAAALGAGSLREWTLELRAAGPHVMVETSLGFGDAARGLFAALFPDTGEVPKLLHLIPDDAPSWKTGHFDVAALYDAALGAATANSFPSRAELEQQIRDFLGFDLRKDLLALASHDYLLFGTSWMTGQSQEDQDERRGPLHGGCFIWKINDDEAFSKRLDTLLDRVQGLMNGEPETVEHRGVTIRTLREGFPDDPAFAVADDLLLIGFGDAGVARMRAAIDADLDKRDADTEPPALIAQRLRHAPPGLNGYAVTPAAGLFGEPVTDLLEDLDREMPAWLPIGDLFLAAREHLRPLLDRDGLREVVTMTGYAERRWRFRLLW